MAFHSTCPICLGEFTKPSAFALHVAECVSLQPLPSVEMPASPPAAKVSSCPYCHMVYTSDLPAHHIEFHEEECELHNDKTALVSFPVPSTKTTGPASGAKRPRESVDKSPSPVQSKTTTTSAAATASPAKAASSASSSLVTKPATKPASKAKAKVKVNVKAKTVTTTAVTTARARAVALFPSFCAVCDGGGRTLLRCAGKCARAFHPLCVEEINARDASPVWSSKPPPLGPDPPGSVMFATAITRNKKLQKEWVCGECTRGLHACQLCGFLGHEAHELTQCSLPDCGFFFHAQCLQEQNYRVRSPLICPRHTCSSCHAVEWDMEKCSSCTQCCTAQHILCREAAAAGASTSTRSRGDVMDSNFFICGSHKPASETKEQAAMRHLRHKYTNFSALKMNVRVGDVVLLLEYNNLLLPDSAKEAAPDALNQWGIVQRVEQLGHGVSPAWWTQLLTITLFADDSSIDVPNQYVLPVSSMRQYTSPVKMICDAIKWHTMAEARLRACSEGHSVASDRKAILSAASSAFEGRAGAVGLRAAQRQASASAGFEAWEGFQSAVSKTQLSTDAPVFIALDTRGQTKSHDVEMEEATPPPSNESNDKDSSSHDDDGDEDDDVDMDSDNPNTSSNISKSSALQFTSKDVRKAVAMVEEDVVVAMERMLEGVLANCRRGRLLGGSSSKRMDEEIVILEVDSADDDEEDMSDGSSWQNRLSIDDLLNPSSQNQTLTPVLAPQRRVDDWDLEETKESDTPRASEMASSLAIETMQQPLSHTQAVSNEADVPRPALVTQATTSEPPAKKPKIQHVPHPSVAVKFTHLPVEIKQSRSSVFGRVPLPLPLPLRHREKMMAQMPSVMVKELQTQVDAFFNSEQDGSEYGRALPSLRPAFYRPSPFLYRGPRIGRRIDGISRVLLCQDKRDLKCFVRDASSKTQQLPVAPFRRQHPCRYGSPATGTQLCVTVDLMGIPNFKVLEHVIHGRVASVVTPPQDPLGSWRWQTEAGEELQIGVSRCTAVEIRLSYCAYDGSEHTLPSMRSRNAQSSKQQPEWLCFCANVVHLTATVMQQQ